MTDTAIFTIDRKRGTKQYSFVCEADARDSEKIAHMALLEKAKTEGMLEWCFLEPVEGIDFETGTMMINYSMMANPFHTEQSPNKSLDEK